VGTSQCRLEVGGMSNGVWTAVASGEPKVEAMCKVMYEVPVRDVGKE